MKLQDLTKNKKYPCVLDLKMGFKALTQKDDNKFQSTTSSSVGFRFCGMNVYQPLKKNVIFKDKYWGRSIQQENLKSSFQSFFYDGEKIRIGLVKRFIKQLKELKDILQYYIGYKFHSSSLLLIYDGVYSADSFKIKEKEERTLSQNKNSQLNQLFKTQSCNSPLSITKNKNRILQIQNNKYQHCEDILHDLQQFNLSKNLSNIPANIQHVLGQKLNNIRNKKLSQDQLIQNENISNQNIINQNQPIINEFSNHCNSNQQSSYFNNIDQKMPLNNYQKYSNNTCNSKIKSSTKENDLIQNENEYQIIQIKACQKQNSKNSDNSLDCKIEQKIQIIQNGSKDVTENEECYEVSNDSSDQTLNNSFMSQCSDSSNLSTKIENQTRKELGIEKQKSLISSHSQESFSFNQSKPRSILKLIDFANIEINEEVDQPDLDLIKGIENLIDIFEDICKNDINTSFVIKNQNLMQQNENEDQNKSDGQTNEGTLKKENDNVNNILDELKNQY